ncbi:MAG: hypothetical protein GMKNLPBB_02394 [Myxococcota bacterium]|nr:hypothetical protein [Myxococcota bacterium]
MKVRVLQSLLICCALTSAVPARASGFLISKIGGDTAGPTANSPSSLFWNPAAIGRISGTSLYLDNNTILRSASFTRDTTAEYAAPLGRRFARETLTTLSVQPMLAATSDFGLPWLTAGIGVYFPFGSRAAWENPNGAQRWQSIWGGITGMYITPALVITPVEWLHAGGSFSIIQCGVKSYRAVDFGEFVPGFTNGPPPPPEEPGNEGRVELDFSGWAYSWAVGVVAEPLKTLQIGLSFTSWVDVDLDGQIKLYPPRNQFRTLLGGEDPARPARLNMTWPAAIRAGVTWSPWEKWTFRLISEYATWRQYKEVRITVDNSGGGFAIPDVVQRADWHDAVNIRAGGRYRILESLSIFLGAGAENGAIPDGRMGPDLFDSFKIGVAGGAIWRMTEMLELNAGYNHIFFLPKTIATSENSPPASGDYSSHVGFLNTNVTVFF